MAETTPVPGWYQDAVDARLMRWWDGIAWTDFTQPAPTSFEDPSADSSFAAESTAADTTAADTTTSHSAAADTTAAHATAHQPVSATVGAAVDTGVAPPEPDGPAGGWTVEPSSHGGGPWTMGGLEAGHVATAPLSRRERRALEGHLSADSPGGDEAHDQRAQADQPASQGSAPVTSAPAHAAPAHSAPAHSVPAHSAPALSVPAHSAPVESAPAHAAPAHSTPVESAPAPSVVPAADVTDEDEAPSPVPASAALMGFSPATAVMPPAEPTAAAQFAPASAPAWTSPSTFAMPGTATELASADYEPMARGPRKPSSQARPLRAGTVGAWVIAFSPLIGLGLIVGGAVALWFLVLDGATTVSANFIPTADLATIAAVPVGLSVVSFLILVLAVNADRRRLSVLGFDSRPSAWWILLGPLVYLIARTVAVRRDSGKGSAPLWGYIVITVLLVGVGTATPFLVPRDAGVAQLRAVEASIEADLSSELEGIDVLCPDRADARIGSTFVCDARDADGEVLGLITVRWTGFDGSVDYSVDFGAATATSLTS